eukprot:CAMPEP_0204571062 /NCGR_PEP_ID=MMETSP0661-20131031/38669_1 /ASSEMBLY_ACC=CAM_ASM_000606 /TAXON_ID=109239 /ORGANISM="Alexandrium margalefi, Strain AMGDE01CS-322" /LENGTH=269 /DNA_ID=CAMNT_0051579287 /DNA_START=63 /DNA_END=872 /DNA_ORIENTATION=+
MKFEGAVFVVTGGASGIGEATTRMALSHGARVAIWDLQADLGEALVKEFGADRVSFSKVNVSDEGDVDAAVQACVAKFGRIDCCVNCAGVGGPGGLTVNKDHSPHKLSHFVRIVQINLVGSFLCASRCAAQMSRQEPNGDGERGLIVNISSVAAMDGQNGQAGYSASKAGVVGMTLPMARDLGKYGVRVNTICPGMVDTPMGGTKKPIDDRDPEKMPRVGKALLTSQLFPSRRFARPAEMANLVKFMFETPFMNAETVRLDAGIRMPKL